MKKKETQNEEWFLTELEKRPIDTKSVKKWLLEKCKAGKSRMAEL